jgi:N-methylhydantoinase A
MLTLDFRRDYVVTRPTRLDAAALRSVERTFDSLMSEAFEDLSAAGVTEERMVFERRLDVRYLGHEQTANLAMPSSIEPAEEMLHPLVQAFHGAHEREHAVRLDQPIEVVTCRLTAFGLQEQVQVPKVKDRYTGPAFGSRAVDFGLHGVLTTAAYLRSALAPYQEIAGPAVIDEPATVTVVPPDCTAHMDEWGAVHIDITGQVST